jgi:DNA uptake protein ComE-like DNA-binding protein
VLAQAQGADPIGEQESASLKAVCGSCHNLQVVLGARMSYGAWHDTVQTMLDRGAKGTDEQLDDVMDYLHRNLTTINVNEADAAELAIILEVPDSVAEAIVSRRKAHRFENIQDLESVRGLDRAALARKSKQLFF